MARSIQSSTLEPRSSSRPFTRPLRSHHLGSGGDGGGDGEGGFIHAGVRRYVKVMTASPRRRRVAV